MEFLGIGYQEVLLVFILMMVVVGPQRMPGVAYQIGKAVREMQKYARAVRDEFSEEWEYLDTQAKELRGEMDSASHEMREIQRSMRSETAALDSELKSASGEVQKALPTPAKNGSSATKPTLSSALRKPALFPGSPAGKVSTALGAADKLRAAMKPAEKQEPQTESAPTESTETEPAAPASSNKPPLVF